MSINCTRRRFLAGTIALSALPLLFGAKKPVTPAATFDKRVQEFMNDGGIPGGALAVVKDRRLVYARGYGWADRNRKLAATPESLFRIASLSKAITAVALPKLVEQNRIALDQCVFDLLALDAKLPEGANLDERWRRITLSQLLHHTGGWDPARHAGDPMFLAKEYLAKRFPDLPAGSPWAIVRFQLAKSLDFEPGTRFAYSGFGYCLLGRVIEKVTGQTYEAFVRESVLAPAGIKCMRLGRSVERAQGEVQYYDQNDERAPNGINFEAMDAGGGWIASVVDLGRFAAALDDRERSPILKRSTFGLMYAPPFPAAPRTDGIADDAYYSCGWCVRPLGKKSQANYWHYGDMPGTDAFLVRFANGFSVAI
jgi:N-acyl-D-amino-acid deacylase